MKNELMRIVPYFPLNQGKYVETQRIGLGAETLSLVRVQQPQTRATFF